MDCVVAEQPRVVITLLQDQSFFTESFYLRSRHRFKHEDDELHVIAAYEFEPREYKFVWWINHCAPITFEPHVNQHHD